MGLHFHRVQLLEQTLALVWMEEKVEYTLNRTNFHCGFCSPSYFSAFSPNLRLQMRKKASGYGGEEICSSCFLQMQPITHSVHTKLDKK